MKTMNVKNIFLLAACILIDLGGKFIALQMSLPVWLDCAGTCLAAYYLGIRQQLF